MSARQEARDRRDARAARAATLAAAEASAAAHAISGAAEQAREELEARIHAHLSVAWRQAVAACAVSLGSRGVPLGYPGSVAVASIIMPLADAYAEAVAVARISRELDDRARQRRLASAEASAAEHRERLGQATS